MKYLIDANVWLEALLQAEHSDEVLDLLDRAPAGSLATTDYVVHALGILLTPRDPELFREFIEDLSLVGVFTLHLPPSQLLGVLDIVESQQLDFDDAFQYVAAERDELTLVSFDSDFDRTPRGRKTPAQVLADLGASAR